MNQLRAADSRIRGIVLTPGAREFSPSRDVGCYLDLRAAK